MLGLPCAGMGAYRQRLRKVDRQITDRQTPRETEEEKGEQ